MTNAASSLDLTKIRISKLQSKDCVKHFCCGESEIDRWVSGKAVKFSEQRRSSVFYAHSHGANTALGVYSLSFSLEKTKKLVVQDHRDQWSAGVPLIYLTYLAVDRKCQRQRLGRHLLIDCLRRAYAVSEHVAFYGIGLRSLNHETTRLYSEFGFGIAKDEDTNRNPLMILPVWSIIDLFEKP